MNIREGEADQITLPSGKLHYTGVNSMNSMTAKERGWPCKKVKYRGCCISSNINNRVHDRFPVEIDGVDTKTFIEKIATDREIQEAMA